MGTAIVAEGGAMRGVFTAGVLDVLAKAQLTEFDLAVGSSAGATNLASFVAGQHGRNIYCYREIACSQQFFNIRRGLRGGHFMDLDWLWTQFDARSPLDVSSVLASPTSLVATSTCARTGRANYHPLDHARMNEPLKAGCALPLLYRGTVSLPAGPAVDGGVSAPIPALEAYRRGARRIVGIRSRPAKYRKTLSAMDLLGSAVLSPSYPKLARAMLGVSRTYNRSVDFLENPPPEVEVLQLAPPSKMRTSRTTRDPETLQRDYELGGEQATLHLRRIERMLTGNTPEPRAR